MKHQEIKISIAGMPYATGTTEATGIYASVILSEAESFIHFHEDKVDMSIVADIFLMMFAGYTMGIETVTESPEDWDLFDADSARERFVDESMW